MIESMTGFGKAACELDNKVVTVEVKSLNSKQLDIYTRLPNMYKKKSWNKKSALPAADQGES
jgi:uncharacterized protein YicC (UPF0701 family)